MASLILLVDVVLNAFTVYVRDGYDKTYDIVTHVYNILCCVLVFYLQFSMMTIFEKQREVETVLRALHQSQLQYEGHREKAELINIKCHDLKHQIARFEANGIDRETVENIEKLVAMYDTTVKTGNEVLDVVLTEKRLGCVAKDIKLTVMADGASLSFIKEGDLYALFGNILDNAIEAVAQYVDASPNGHRELFVLRTIVFAPLLSGTPTKAGTFGAQITCIGNNWVTTTLKLRIVVE